MGLVVSPFIGATPDALQQSGDGVVEILHEGLRC